MNTRTKILIIAGIVVLVLIAILLLFFNRKQSPPIANQPQNQTQGNLTNSNTTGGAQPVTKPAQPMSAAELSQASREISIKNAVKNFVERFGSYSVESNFSNFDEIKPLATPQVVTWLASYPQDLLSKQSADFLGVSTVLLSQKITKADDKNAEVSASTQQEETTKSGKKISYKDIKVKLVASGNSWLVDGVYWQE